MTFVKVPITNRAGISVPPEGDKTAKIAFIGMAPAKNEEEQGRPFVGRAGQVFEQCLHAAGIARAEVYITNLSKTRLEGDRESVLWSSKGGLTSYGRECQAQLREEFQEVSANVIITLGNAPMDALCEKRGITKWRGSILESTLLPRRKVIPTIHPASISYGDFFARYYIKEDFDRSLFQSKFSEIRLENRNYIIRPSWQDATDYVDSLWRARGIVSWDIETIGGEVSCISFAPNQYEAMSIPNSNYSPSGEAAVWKSISRLLDSEDTPKLGMNLIFDTQFVLAHNRIQTRGYIDDIMIAHHILYPDFPKGLDFLVSFNGKGEPYYKDEGKQWKLSQIKDWDQFWTYNAKDSTHAFLVWDAIKDKIKESGFWEFYRDTMDYFDPVNFMVLMGILVDPDAIKKTEKKTVKDLEELQEKLDTLVGYPINAKSSQQCKKYFYEELRITPLTRYNKQTKKSAPTMDDKALQTLARGSTARPAIPAAKVIQQIRSLRDLKSKYLDITFDKDNRFRCSYNLRGTVTGRFSSSKTINQTGGNHQNLPKAFRSYLIPDENQMFIEWDKTQAEWVVVAFISGDSQMMHVVEEKLDVHAFSGAAISNLPIEYVTLEDDYVGNSRNAEEVEEARIRLDREHPEWGRPKLRTLYPNAYWPRSYSIRQVGKHSNHGFNYDMAAARFALEYETDLSEAKRIYNGYHDLYPGLKRMYSAIQNQLSVDRTLVNCYGHKRRFYGEWGDDLFKSAYDFIPQSTVAVNNKRGMIRIYRDRTEWMRPVSLCLEGHDSVLAQAPVSLGMRNLSKIIYTGIEHMHDDLEYGGRRFSIGTDVKIGFNWRDMIELNLSNQTIGTLELELPSILEKAREKHEKSRR